MRMSEEDFERRGMYNELKFQTEKECGSFGAKCLSFSIENEYDKSSLHFFDFKVEMDVTGLRNNDEVESLKVCINSDLLSVLMDNNEKYTVGNINFVIVGKPKKGGFFSRFF